MLPIRHNASPCRALRAQTGQAVLFQYLREPETNREAEGQQYPRTLAGAANLSRRFDFPAHRPDTAGTSFYPTRIFQRLRALVPLRLQRAGIGRTAGERGRAGSHRDRRLTPEDGW